MFSLSPSTPGRRVQMLRARISTSTPFCGRLVELLDDVSVRQVVDLDADPTLLAGGRRGRGRTDLLDQPLAQVERRDQELAEPCRAAKAGQEVEEVGDVRGDVRVDRKEAEVLIRPCSCGVVVAGADVRVSVQLAALAPNDKRRLRVDFQVREPVDDVDAGLLERVGPADVPALVEAGLQLNEADRLLALLRRLDQRRHERRVTAGPVDGGLQRRGCRRPSPPR
jgi:hypothetical protein